MIQWELYIDKTYVLYLPKNIQRKKSLQNQLKKIETDKGTLSNYVTWWEGYQNVKDWNKKLHNSWYSYYYHWLVDPDKKLKKSMDEMENEYIECSSPETSIALSHVSILQDIVKNDIGVALIMEDDVLFKSNFTQKLKNIFDKK